MAVFALDCCVLRGTVHLAVLTVAPGTTLHALVLDRDVLPLLDVAQAIEVVCKRLAVYTEVIGDHEMPGDQNHGDKANRYPERAEYMVLHAISRVVRTMRPTSESVPTNSGARVDVKPPYPPCAADALASCSRGFFLRMPSVKVM
jgi:hypothetical protein